MNEYSGKKLSELMEFGISWIKEKFYFYFEEINRYKEKMKEMEIFNFRNITDEIKIKEKALTQILFMKNNMVYGYNSNSTDQKLIWG